MMRSQDGEDAGADDGSSGAPIESDFQERRFRLSEPRRLSSCVVFSSPHSGRAYFREFLAASRLGPLQLRASEDAYVDALVDGAVEFGAPVLSAVAPRAFLDLNRGPEELDPSLVIGARGRAANARVLAGLGVVPRIVAEGVSIYRAADAAVRGAPAHRGVACALSRPTAGADAGGRGGGSARALLLDFHSMPSMSPKRRARPQGETAAEIVLGDRFGASAPPDLVDEVEAAFLRGGLSHRAQRAVRRRIHHRAIRPAGDGRAARSRSRSIGRSISTKPACGRARGSTICARRWRRCCGCSAA